MTTRDLHAEIKDEFNSRFRQELLDDDVYIIAQASNNSMDKVNAIFNKAFKRRRLLGTSAGEVQMINLIYDVLENPDPEPPKRSLKRSQQEVAATIAPQRLEPVFSEEEDVDEEPKLFGTFTQELQNLQLEMVSAFKEYGIELNDQQSRYLGGLIWKFEKDIRTCIKETIELAGETKFYNNPVGTVKHQITTGWYKQEEKQTKPTSKRGKKVDVTTLPKSMRPDKQEIPPMPEDEYQEKLKRVQQKMEWLRNKKSLKTDKPPFPVDYETWGTVPWDQVKNKPPFMNREEIVTPNTKKTKEDIEHQKKLKAMFPHWYK